MTSLSVLAAWALYPANQSRLSEKVARASEDKALKSEIVAQDRAREAPEKLREFGAEAPPTPWLEEPRAK
jgi:hypothetical protein